MDDFQKKENLIRNLDNNYHQPGYFERSLIEVLCDIRDVLTKILYKN